MSESDISPSTQIYPQTSNIKPASLYIGDLDVTIREQQLIELFRSIGPILSVNICRDIITQKSLGYAYINFQNSEDAKKALNTLNFTQLGNSNIRIMWQQRDPSLRYSGVGNIFVKNLKENTKHKDLYEMFKHFGSILSCKVMCDHEGKQLNYGFVHFQNERAAQDAVKIMNGSNSESNTNGENDLKAALYVAHFIRRNSRLNTLLENFTNVYIKQILPEIDCATIEKFFRSFGNITSSITKQDSKGRTFAFCNFESHDDAVKAIETLHGTQVKEITGDNEIYVQRAQNRSERLFELRQKFIQRQFGTNLYVRNFDQYFTSDDLKDLFSSYGEITSCKIMTDDKGTSRGFGFVSFTDVSAANKALQELNGRMLNNRPLYVNIAQKYDQRVNMLQMQFKQQLQCLLSQIMYNPFCMYGPTGGPLRILGQKMPMQNQLTSAISAPLPMPVPFLGQTNQISNPNFPPMASTPAIFPHQPLPNTHTNLVNQLNVSNPQQTVSSQEIAEIDHILKLPPEEQRERFGEKIFAKIIEIEPEITPKLTGVLLDQPISNIVEILKNPIKFNSEVEEALCVIKANKVLN